MIDLGVVKPGSTIRIPFSTFKGSDGSSLTMTNFAASDLLCYKDGSTTERASTSGFTATTDFDSKTGKQLAVIDLADNTTAGFWTAGSEYLIAIDAVTVDAVTTGTWIARFVIGYPGATLDTTIATLSSQTSFTLTNGPAEDDALKDQWAVIHDIASAVQCARVLISAYTGATKTVTLAAGATFTVAAGDNISIMGPAPMQPATTGRKPVVDTNGLIDANAVKINGTSIGGTGTQVADAFTSFFNVASPTGTVNSLPAAVPGASNGVFIAGSNAATTLATWTVTGATTFTGNIAAQAGLYISQSASNAPGLWITGNGTGEAARLAGGNTVGTSAVSIVAAASSGYGVSIGGVSGLGTNLASLVVGGSTTLTGAVTSTHASNDIRGVKISGTLTTLDAVWAKIQKWLRLGFRKDAAVAADHATELSEINADGGSGSGTFDNTTDATEAIRDSALTQTQVTGGAYALNSSSFAFNSALDLTTTQKASVTDAVPRKVKKNTALADFQFVMLDSVTKLPAAGKTVTVERNIDDADSFVAGTLSAVSEVGNGVYRVSFAAADLNGNIIVLRATATGCDPTIERILTTP